MTANNHGLEAQYSQQTIESVGEDMPNAFRTVPCHPDDLLANVTGMLKPSTHTWKFQEMRALMFGYRCGVINSNRRSTFIEGVVQRCLRRRTPEGPNLGEKISPRLGEQNIPESWSSPLS